MDPALAPPPVDAGIFTAVDTPPSILPVTSFSADFTLRPSTTCGHPDDTALTIPLSVVNLSAAAAKRQVRDIEAQVLPVDPSLDGTVLETGPELVHRTMTMLGDFLASLGVLISFSTVSASDSPGRATVPASAAPQENIATSALHPPVDEANCWIALRDWKMFKRWLLVVMSIVTIILGALQLRKGH